MRFAVQSLKKVLGRDLERLVSVSAYGEQTETLSAGTTRVKYIRQSDAAMGTVVERTNEAGFAREKTLVRTKTKSSAMVIIYRSDVFFPLPPFKYAGFELLDGVALRVEVI